MYPLFNNVCISLSLLNVCIFCPFLFQGNSGSNIKAKAEAFMAELRSKSSEDLASSKQKGRDRSASSSSLKSSGKSPQKDTTSTGASEEEKGVDFDSILTGKGRTKSENEGDEGKLIHLTANRAKAPKRRPPSSHFTSGTNAREVLIFLFSIYSFMQICY